METTTINSMEKFMESSTSESFNEQLETTSRSSDIVNFISSAAMNLLNLDTLLNDAHNIHQEEQQQQLQQQHNQHHQITFEVPTKHDLLHIETLHQHQQNLQKQQQQLHQQNSLNNLLERFGNAALEVFSSSGITSNNNNNNDNHYNQHHNDISKLSDSITNEQLSKSVVLNLSDMKTTAATTALTTATSNNNDNNLINNSWLENLFNNDDVDVHTIINYLWIGVVCALIILSLVFIMFSVYFYRKFRIWKQCNKDIRAQLQANGINSNNINNPNNILYNSEAALLAPCLSNYNNNNNNNNGNSSSETAYYQMMLSENTNSSSATQPPPCYTIATGLPTYDEALHRQHYAFGMRILYPAMSVLCTSQQQQQQKIQFSMQQQQQQQQQKLLMNNTATTSTTAESPATTTIQLPPSYTEAVLALALTRQNSRNMDNADANDVSSVCHKKYIKVATLPGEPTGNISTISDENISASSNVNDFVIDLS